MILGSRELGKTSGTEVPTERLILLMEEIRGSPVEVGRLSHFLVGFNRYQVV